MEGFEADPDPLVPELRQMPAWGGTLGFLHRYILSKEGKPP
jgi:hypothetical protein